jgi:hypothetical protein
MTEKNLVYAILTIGVVLFSPLSAHSWEQTIGDKGSGIHWTSSCYHYSLHRDGTDDVDFEYLVFLTRKSFDAWEDHDCSHFYFEATDPASVERVEVNSDKGNVNLLIWREELEDWPYDRAAVAMTTTHYNLSTGEILDVDIEFNGAWFDFGTLSGMDSSSPLVDLQSAMTHEIGHTLGFDDQFAELYRDSTMYGYDTPGEIGKRNLTEDDTEGLCTLYPIADDPNLCEAPLCGIDLDGSSTECDQAPPVDGGTDYHGSDDGCRAAPAQSRRSLIATVLVWLLPGLF